ncbi:MAG: NUDIX domain-containing protein [Planctomycetota bacterium]|nr:NUDIX domain-containing protein [Planctomycetota bacterium]
MTDRPPVSAPPGPRLRTDLVDVYVFRRPDGRAPEFLQLRRARPPMHGTWQPVMGHVEPGESAPHAALRELQEETGLSRTSPALRGFWALESVHPFYLAGRDEIVLSPRFAVEVDPAWKPDLTRDPAHPHEPAHDDARWTASADAFIWPGQRACIAEIYALILPEVSPVRAVLAIDPATVAR